MVAHVYIQSRKHPSIACPEKRDQSTSSLLFAFFGVRGQQQTVPDVDSTNIRAIHAQTSSPSMAHSHRVTGKNSLLLLITKSNICWTSLKTSIGMPPSPLHFLLGGSKTSDRHDSSDHKQLNQIFLCGLSCSKKSITELKKKSIASTTDEQRRHFQFQKWTI